VIKNTIPHSLYGKFGAGKVIMRPASPGTGVIAGGPVRAIMECLGVTDVLTKSLGSPNPHNVVKAAFAGLEKAMDALQMARKRSRKVGDIFF